MRFIGRFSSSSTGTCIVGAEKGAASTVGGGADDAESPRLSVMCFHNDEHEFTIRDMYCLPSIVSIEILWCTHLWTGAATVGNPLSPRYRPAAP